MVPNRSRLHQRVADTAAVLMNMFPLLDGTGEVGSGPAAYCESIAPGAASSQAYGLVARVKQLASWIKSRRTSDAPTQRLEVACRTHFEVLQVVLVADGDAMSVESVNVLRTIRLGSREERRCDWELWRACSCCPARCP